jgi:hypothetical protein
VDRLYGCFTLFTNNIISPADLPIPFGGESLVCKTGCHLPRNNSSENSAGSFILASPNPRQSLFVPSRNERIDAICVGSKKTEEYAVKHLVIVNSEPNEMKMAKLVKERIYDQLSGTFMVCMSQTGPHSKILILTKNIELYLLGVCDDEDAFLIWSNEVQLEERMREAYRNKFLYYRFPIYNRHSIVLQSQYICSRFRRWNREMRDNLRIFSALENFITTNILRG